MKKVIIQMTEILYMNINMIKTLSKMNNLQKGIRLKIISMFRKKNNHNVIGIGTDIISIARFQKSVDRSGQKFIDKIFTEKEQEYCNKFSNPTPHYAARFSVKEAVGKAFGLGIGGVISFQEIEICNTKEGKPFVVISNKIKKHFNDPKIEISLSHCEEYATANVIILC